VTDCRPETRDLVEGHGRNRIKRWDRLDARSKGPASSAALPVLVHCLRHRPNLRAKSRPCWRRSVEIERLVGTMLPEPDPFIGMRRGRGASWSASVMAAWERCLAERADGQCGSASHSDHDRLAPAGAARGSGKARISGDSRPTSRLARRWRDARRLGVLVMQRCVDGCPVTTTYVRAALDGRTAPRLFRSVADATQHAHQSLVVHRDLKPRASSCRGLAK
jgi:hypothetical protein